MPSERARREREALHLMRRLSMHVRFHIAAALRRFELNPPAAMVLQLACEPAPMGTIADHLGVDASYVTAIADELEQRGLAERSVSPDDRRVRLLATTDAGRALTREIADAVAESVDVFRGLDDEELAALTRVLTKALSTTRPTDARHGN